MVVKMSAYCRLRVSSIQNDLLAGAPSQWAAHHSNTGPGVDVASAGGGGVSIEALCLKRPVCPRYSGWEAKNLYLPFSRPQLGDCAEIFRISTDFHRLPRGRSARALAGGEAPSVPPDPLLGTGATVPEGAGAATEAASLAH